MASIHLSIILCLFASSLIVYCEAFFPTSVCKGVKLPQKESVWLFVKCPQERSKELADKRKVYGRRDTTSDMPYARLDMDIPKYAGHLAKTAFLAEHSLQWAVQGLVFKITEGLYRLTNDLKGKQMSEEDFMAIREFFRIHTSSPSELMNSFSKKAQEASKDLSDKLIKEIHQFMSTLGFDQLITALKPISNLLTNVFGHNSFLADSLKTVGWMLNSISLTKNTMRNPSSTANFQNDVKEWISDKFFAEQRLSGVNPMTIQRVTFSDDVGMNYQKLKIMLNPSFKLVQAVNKILPHVTNNEQLEKAIKDGHLFVLYHSISSGLRSSDDLTDHDENRKMWDYKSPIALFASINDDFLPVAIQMDYKRDSDVFTPQDGDQWMMAKLSTQLADYSTSQIVEHLCKVHFTVEPICLAVERQLSVRHPLHDMMRVHCRGIFTANTLGGPVLLDEKLDLNKVMEFGSKGANILVKKAAQNIHWSDLDLKINIKRRGLDDKKTLPYYPYRDDGLELYNILENMITEYVNEFYIDDKDVELDNELQSFAKELHFTKIGKDGGSIRGFPSKITSKSYLMKTFARILWLMTGQHSAINYPQADYGSYVPNSPLKLYDVKGLAKGSFTLQRLENRETSAIQVSLISSLSSFRMDKLFDYEKHLNTKGGKKIVKEYKLKLDRELAKTLKERDTDRLRKGHLTYPYFYPEWLTNGIQA